MLSSKNESKQDARFAGKLDVLTERVDSLASTLSTTASSMAKKDGEIAALRRELEARDQTLNALVAHVREQQQAPAADAPLTVASALAAEADVPPALVAGTEAVRATAGDIELGTASAALQTEPEAVNVAGADATEGELRITSEPSGAVVTVNGVGWGPTPVTIRYMPFGKKLIRVTKPGYASAQRGFEFVPDRRVQSVRIQLSAESPDAR